MKIVKPDPITTTGYVTRTGIATYYDSSGYLKTSTVGALRFGYNPSNLEFNGLVIEQSSTNLVLQSAAFNSASWTKTNLATITTDTEVAPTNTQIAEKLVPTITSGLHAVTQVFTTSASAGQNYTVSVFAKSAGYAWLKVQFDNHYCFFNIKTGYVGTVSDTGNKTEIEKLPNGWFRISMSRQITSIGNLTAGFYLHSLDNQSSWSGNTTSGIALYGAQAELKSKMTSYIDTTTAAVSRAAEVITGSGLLYTNVTNPYSEWSSATTYSLGQIIVVGTYTGSNIVDITSSGTYKSLTNSNLNNNPVTSPTSWVRIGPTNQFAVFDNVISSSTVKDSDIIFVVKSTSVDSVAVLNSTSDKINCAVSDASYSETFLYNIAYSRTTQLNGSESIDWFSYFFFDEYVQKTQAIYLDIPQVSNGIVSIKITGTVNVTAGSFVEGQIKVLGATQYGASAGITDYSKKEVDEFGNTVLVVRNYSKRMQAKIFLSNSNLNTVQRILYSIRATPVLWIASDDSQLEEPLIVMGYYKDFDTEIAYPAHSLCNLTIEGLI